MVSGRRHFPPVKAVRAVPVAVLYFCRTNSGSPTTQASRHVRWMPRVTVMTPEQRGRDGRRRRLTTAFEEHRPHLRAVAYRLLGSMADADDAVQDTWLRLSGADTSQVENLGGWLTTVVARVSLNVLRSRRSRAEEPVGDSWPGAAETAAWAAEKGASGLVSDPEDEAVLADSVGLALLVVLDALTPAERLAFVLHDMFAMPFTIRSAGCAARRAAGRQGRYRRLRRGRPGSACPGERVGGHHRRAGRSAAGRAEHDGQRRPPDHPHRDSRRSGPVATAAAGRAAGLTTAGPHISGDHQEGTLAGVEPGRAKAG